MKKINELSGSINRIKSSDAIIALCLLLLGLVIMLQLKTVPSRPSPTQSSFSSEIADLRERLQREVQTGKELSEEYSLLLQKYDAYVEAYAVEIMSADLDNKIEELRDLRLLAGLTDVRGPGVTVTMKDANIRENADPMLFLIHDIDILRVLNELRASGAQAISINDERLLPVSEIMCSGPTVRINRNRYPVPYVIHAIGDPNTLAAALEKSLIVELLKDYDITVRIERKSDIIIKKYRGSLEWTLNSLEVAK